MNKKIGKSIFLLVSTLILLTGCNSGKNNSPDVTEQTKSEEAVVYQPSFVELTCNMNAEDVMSSRAFSYMFVSEKAVYGIAVHSDSLTHTQSSYVVIKDIEGDGYSEKKLGMLGDFFETGEGFAGYSNKKFTLYDGSFEVLKEIELNKVEAALSDKNERLSVKDVGVDGSGNICIVCENQLVFIDGEGNILGVTDKPANNGGYGYMSSGRVVSSSGKWYFMCINNESKVDIYNVDMASGQMDVKLENVPDIYESNMRDIGVSGDGTLYIITQDYIYSYNSDNTEYTALTCLRDYGIDSSDDSGKSAFSRSQSGTFYIASVETIDLPGMAGMSGSDTVNGQTTADVTIEVAAIEGKNASQVSERKELVLSAFTTPSWIYADPINKFNRYNTEYYVTVKSYFNYDDNEYDTALTSFYNDLVTGNGADIFWFNADDNVDIDNLADKGVLADLYTYLDKDGDIDRDDFIPNVLQAMDSNDKLYVMAPEFKLATIAGSVGLLEGDEEWSFTAMCGLLDKYSGAQMFVSGRNGDHLERFLRYSMDLFYDKETGVCSFESDEFVNMLRLAKSLPDTYTYIEDDEVNDKLKKNEVLLEDVDGIDTMTIKTLDAHFGNIEKAYFGYPSKSHTPATIVFDYSLAVNELSDNREAAWEFVKYYLMNFKPQKMSVLADSFEEQLDSAMHEYENDVRGQNPLSSNLSSEQADTLRSLAYTASGYKQYDMSIYNIVYEEAMSFISGQRSADEAAAIIQNRVQLYLDERD